MSEISKALQKLIEAPEDLSALPSLVAKVQELETAETNYLDRIARLQEVNKTYLAQIPIPGNEPEPEVEEEKEPTIEDATASILNALNTGGE